MTTSPLDLSEVELGCLVDELCRRAADLDDEQLSRLADATTRETLTRIIEDCEGTVDPARRRR